MIFFFYVTFSNLQFSHAMPPVSLVIYVLITNCQGNATIEIAGYCHCCSLRHHSTGFCLPCYLPSGCFYLAQTFPFNLGIVLTNCLTLPMGVNLQCLHLNHLRQVNVIHIPEFGYLHWVHISVDTSSGFIFASAHTGEAAKHKIVIALMLLVPLTAAGT